MTTSTVNMVDLARSLIMREEPSTNQEYDRRDAYLNNVRKAIRYQALANEMSDVFQEWLMPVQDQFTLSNYIAMLNIRAAKLMEPRHET